MANSTRSRRANKSAKPHKDFPLFAHQNGQWAKKVKGRIHYFGTWDDPSAALSEWNDHKDNILEHGVKKTEPDADGSLTLNGLLDRFLTEKLDLVNSGEITAGTYKDYHAACQFTANGRE